MFGFTRSSLDFNERPRNSVAGLSPVVLCGALRYASKNAASLSCMGQGSVGLRTSFCAYF